MNDEQMNQLDERLKTLGYREDEIETATILAMSTCSRIQKILMEVNTLAPLMGKRSVDGARILRAMMCVISSILDIVEAEVKAEEEAKHGTQKAN